MVRTSLVVALSLALAAVSFLGGSWYNNRKTGGTQAGQQTLYYACPMHPHYKSEQPGDCPSCGMRLEPVYAGQAASSSSASLPGAVHVSPEQQQLLGVRVAPAGMASGASQVRTVGRVVADERKIRYLTAAVDGWIEETFGNTTGAKVAKDELLATFYSPQGTSAQLAYINSLGYLSQFPAQEGPSRNLAASFTAQTALDGLRALGMSAAQIDALKNERQLAQSIRITSPAAGIVLARNVAPGKWIAKGTELYQIADLGQVWVLADLFENEARYVRPGQRVTVRYQGMSFAAKASEVTPQFDPATRTLKARFEAENPGYTLRPDMFVDVELHVSLPDAVTVPVDAVIDSGLKKTVYVAKGGGSFQPRLVETGWRFGDRIEITKGLLEGEQIAVSGNFLLDSESRMRTTTGPGDQGTGGQGDRATRRPGDVVIDPVCGMEISPAKAAGNSEYKGTTYYFCSSQCKKDFDRNPEAVLKGKKG